VEAFDFGKIQSDFKKTRWKGQLLLYEIGNNYWEKFWVFSPPDAGKSNWDRKNLLKTHNKKQAKICQKGVYMTNTKKVEMTLEEQLEYVKQNWKKITKTHAVVLKAEDDGYKTNYSIELIVPEGKDGCFTLEQLQKAVGGLIEFVGYQTSFKGCCVIANEEGLILNQPVNVLLWLMSKKQLMLVGNVIIVNEKFIR